MSTPPPIDPNQIPHMRRIRRSLLVAAEPRRRPLERQPRRTPRIAVVAAASCAAIAALVVAPVVRAPEPPVAIAHSDDVLIVGAPSAYDSPDAVERALSDIGLDATVEEVPAPPPLRGSWVHAGGDADIAMPGAAQAVVSRDADQVELGLGADDDTAEEYVVAYDAFAPGGPLADCHHDATVADVLTHFDDDTYEVLWVVEQMPAEDGGEVIATEVADPDPAADVVRAQWEAPHLVTITIAP